MTVTVIDLLDTLADERHLGHGYACTDVLSDSRRARLNHAVVGVANEEGLTRDELFTWSNSKHGRWLADRVYGNNAPISRATVRKELSRKIVDELVAMEAMP